MWEWTPLRDWIAGYITPYWTTPLLLAVQTLMVMVCLILVMAVAPLLSSVAAENQEYVILLHGL